MVCLDTKGLSFSKKKEVTEEIQKRLDRCDDFTFLKGEYLISPLFLHSHMRVHFEEGAILYLTEDENRYTSIFTRYAGIEMMAYPAAITILSCEDVILDGKGLISGQGKKWYEKYWGKDTKGGMRKEYDKQGLRWACDYDCLRPKNILIQDSCHIQINDLTLKDSPFWNLHVLYSNDVVLSRLTIIADDPFAPSTDGIDIDSSYDVLIKNCHISTNDDCISIKSGRDLDGLMINRPSHDIHIEDCVIEKGYGLSLGSELSGGIYGIYASHITFDHSSCGFRIKSSKSRKGYVKEVRLNDILMKEVKYPFYCYLDWNPLYNQNRLPESYTKPIPEYWKKLLSLHSDDIKDTIVEDLEFKNISIFNKNSKDISCLFTFKGFASSPIKKIAFIELKARVSVYGTFEICDEPTFIDCDIKTTGQGNTIPGSFDNR